MGRPGNRINLLEFDLGTSGFELGLELFGFGLVHAFLDSLGSTLDEVLGFLEAQAGDGTDFLDDVDLLITSRRQDNVELVLFFSQGSGSSATSSSNGNRSGGGNAPLLFEHLGQLGSFQDGQCRQVVYELSKISHLISLFCKYLVSV